MMITTINISHFLRVSALIGTYRVEKRSKDRYCRVRRPFTIESLSDSLSEIVLISCYYVIFTVMTRDKLICKTKLAYFSSFLVLSVSSVF